MSICVARAVAASVLLRAVVLIGKNNHLDAAARVSH
jgi:hypothetical protein